MTLGKNQHTSEAKSYLTNLIEYLKERPDEYVDKRNQFILTILKGTQSCPSRQRRL